MIGRVELAGADLDLADVFASVTIRHGRASADDSPLASTATLTLVNVTRDLVAAFSVADELGVYLADDSPRFRGRITDASLGPDGLSIVAVSSLSWLSRRIIGAEDWPAEAWSARVFRAFDEAGYLPSWLTFGTTKWEDLDPARTWSAPLVEPAVTITVGDDDPIIAARVGAPVAFGQYLGQLAADEPAAIANLPNGNVLVQALTARKAIPTIELDPDLVAYSPQWGMIDDVANDVTVTYAGGVAEETDFRSIERFEPRPLSITTELQNLVDATTRARFAVVRRGFAEWLADTAELLELDQAIGIGTPILIPDVPAWAPGAEYLGIVEGWEDHVEPNPDGDGLRWTMALSLSAPRLSGFGIVWSGIPAVIEWADAGAATWQDPESILTT